MLDDHGRGVVGDGLSVNQVAHQKGVPYMVTGGHTDPVTGTDAALDDVSVSSPRPTYWLRGWSIPW